MALENSEGLTETEHYIVRTQRERIEELERLVGVKNVKIRNLKEKVTILESNQVSDTCEKCGCSELLCGANGPGCSSGGGN